MDRSVLIRSQCTQSTWLNPGLLGVPHPLPNFLYGIPHVTLAESGGSNFKLKPPVASPLTILLLNSNPVRFVKVVMTKFVCRKFKSNGNNQQTEQSKLELHELLTMLTEAHESIGQS
jgi:hypothetical protein